MSLCFLEQTYKIGATGLGLTCREFLVFQCLISHGEQSLSNISIPKKQISELCGISVRHITNILRSLESKGFIITKVSICGKQPNIYSIKKQGGF